MRSIIISILLKGTVRNLAHRQCEIRTKTNLINLQSSCPSPKKSKPADYVQKQGYRGGQSAPFCVPVAVLTHGVFTD